MSADTKALLEAARAAVAIVEGGSGNMSASHGVSATLTPHLPTLVRALERLERVEAERCDACWSRGEISEPEWEGRVEPCSCKAGELVAERDRLRAAREKAEAERDALAAQVAVLRDKMEAAVHHIRRVIPWGSSAEAALVALTDALATPIPRAEAMLALVKLADRWRDAKEER